MSEVVENKVKKSIRIQLDFTYVVDEDIAQSLYDIDKKFFGGIGEEVNTRDEHRELVNFEFRHDIGDYNPEG